MTETLRHPSVSVIIPAFNAAGFIGTALQSVFAQSFAEYEVILINDGSSDTEQLEREIAPWLPNLIYRKQQNRGPSAARNLGIQNARGEFLAFLDGDDNWSPEYLAEQWKMLQRDPSLDMIYCDALFLGNTSSAGKTFMELCPSNGPVTFESLLLEETQVVTSGTVVRKQKVVEAGCFDENLHCAEDHDLWLRIAHCGGKIAYHRTVLARHLVRPDSQGASGKLVLGQIQVLRKLNKELDLTPQARSLLADKLRRTEGLLAYTQGRRCLLSGEYEEARRLLAQANTFTPKAKLGALLISLRIAPRLAGLIMRMRDRRRAP